MCPLLPIIVNPHFGFSWKSWCTAVFLFRGWRSSVSWCITYTSCRFIFDPVNRALVLFLCWNYVNIRLVSLISLIREIRQHINILPIYEWCVCDLLILVVLFHLAVFSTAFFNHINGLSSFWKLFQHIIFSNDTDLWPYRKHFNIFHKLQQ